MINFCTAQCRKRLLIWEAAEIKIETFELAHRWFTRRAQLLFGYSWGYASRFFEQMNEMGQDLLIFYRLTF